MVEAGATFSDDGRFRWLLWRLWDASLPTMVFIMLNPSTANAVADDPTTMVCMRIARANGCGGIRIVNLFAYVATDPLELRRAGWPVGEENDSFIRATVAGSGLMVVCAWGAKARGLQRPIDVRTILRKERVSAWAIEILPGGVPRHPLYSVPGPLLVFAP